MKTDNTTDTTGVITPNAAKASRSQTIWYSRLQKPDKKNRRNSVGRMRDRMYGIRSGGRLDRSFGKITGGAEPARFAERHVGCPIIGFAGSHVQIFIGGWFPAQVLESFEHYSPQRFHRAEPAGGERQHTLAFILHLRGLGIVDKRHQGLDGGVADHHERLRRLLSKNPVFESHNHLGY